MAAVEIRTKSARILIDFGSALPDSSGRTATDTLKIEGINQGHPDFDSVFLTHYHGDHLGLIEQIPAEIPIYMGREALEVFAVYADRMKTGLAESILIYSMWDGYLDGRSPALSEFVRPFAETNRLRCLHSSGHATPRDIRAICDQIRPKIGVIPIHTERGGGLRTLGIACPVLNLHDREVLTL